MEGEETASYRNNEVKCPECGKMVSRSRTTECLSCLRRFHSACLVKVKKGRISYRMCRRCVETKPDPDRTVLHQDYSTAMATV
jgi:predicted amidophosphoribosyltransferase